MFASQPATPAPGFSSGTLRVLCDVMIQIHNCCGLYVGSESASTFVTDLLLTITRCRIVINPSFTGEATGNSVGLVAFFMNSDQAAPMWWHQDKDPGPPGSLSYKLQSLLDH